MTNFFSTQAELKKPVLISSLLLFSIICSFVILKSARDALFLSHYSARFLPYIMAINTIISALVATIYLRLYKHFALKRLVSASFLLFVVGIFLFWLHSAHSHHLLAGLLYVWGGIIGTLAPVQAWTMISKQFSTREAKNAMGILGGGATAGGIAGGLIATVVVKITENVYLLIPVAGFILAVTFFLHFILVSYPV